MFVLAVFGIVVITVILITDVLPFRRVPHQVGVVEDVHTEIKKYAEFETKIKDACVFSVKSSALKARIRHTAKRNRTAVFFEYVEKKFRL